MKTIILIITICIGMGRHLAASALEKCSSCGDGWVKYYERIFFKVLSTFLDKEEADNNCQNEGACGGSNGRSHLASIISQDEQLFLNDLLVKTGTDVWIGAERLSKNGNDFIWQDGSELNFTNWAEGNPTPNGHKSVQMSIHSGKLGEWVDRSCSEKAYALCQKTSILSSDKLYEMVVRLENKLSKTRIGLENTKNNLESTRTDLTNTQTDVANTQTDLANTQTDLANTQTDLTNTQTDLTNTSTILENKIESRVVGIEGAFTTSFEVGGDVNFYYPVAFKLPLEQTFLRSPLAYDISRVYFEKAPESLNMGTMHYMGLTLKLLASNGLWDAGSNQIKVLYHDWIYNKGVAKMALFHLQEERLFVWLGGGGVLYHIRSPVDLAEGITAYYEENAITEPAVHVDSTVYPANIVNLIPVGSEDVDLVRPGMYPGWEF